MIWPSSCWMSPKTPWAVSSSTPAPPSQPKRRFLGRGGKAGRQKHRGDQSDYPHDFSLWRRNGRVRIPSLPRLASVIDSDKKFTTVNFFRPNALANSICYAMTHPRRSESCECVIALVLSVVDVKRQPRAASWRVCRIHDTLVGRATTVFWRKSEDFRQAGSWHGFCTIPPGCRVIRDGGQRDRTNHFPSPHRKGDGGLHQQGFLWFVPGTRRYAGRDLEQGQGPPLLQRGGASLFRAHACGRFTGLQHPMQLLQPQI